MQETKKKPGLREQNKEEKLRRIKEAALDLFVSKGFDDTTTREIASKAGVGMGTVFVYAETKRDLLFLIVNDGLEECIAEASAAIRPEDSLLQNLLSVLRLHYEYFARVPVLSRAALREMYFYQSGKQAERFNRTRDKLKLLLTRLISEAMEKGLVSSTESPQIVAQAIFAIYQVDLRMWLSAESLDIVAGLDRLRRQIDVVMRGLSPDPAVLRLDA
ncbi:Fatty acid metabolism regulator protein [Ensifer psoraleae]|uniref:TetR/AcrR family transcriptional regulator n=1 Tax=Sinorhizobium psoraleae TaxID=520838 RepID=UPI00156A4BC3|nr:TetR/AcrR family transcriptional regulator [Sinorhizobium psoraleae]NRP76016.1 Fatty acid metabolism regulator protein [Sinorhizobium psoraleae]